MGFMDNIKQLGDLKKMRDQAMEVQKKLSGIKITVEHRGVTVILTADQKVVSISGEQDFEKITEAVNEALKQSQKGFDGRHGFAGNVMEAFRDPFPQLAVWRQNVPTEALRFSRDLDKAIARYTNPRKRTFYDRQFVRTVTLGKPDALIFVVPTAEEFSEESFAIERSKGHLRIYMKIKKFLMEILFFIISKNLIQNKN